MPYRRLSVNAIVHALIDLKLSEGLSPRTVQYIHAVLRRALGEAVKEGTLARNVASDVSAPQVPRQELQLLSPEQARALLQHVRGDRLEALYTVALAVGLRQGEALALRWQDVDLHAGTLAVNNTLGWLNREPLLMPPKTESSRRTITLPDVGLRSLREHRKRQLEERVWAGESWKGNLWDLVFTSTRGTPLYRRNVTQRLQQQLQAAGLPKVTFHSLRHSCASFLLAQDVSPRVVMEILGHSQISTTLDICAHVMPSMRRGAADRMDTLQAASTG